MVWFSLKFWKKRSPNPFFSRIFRGIWWKTSTGIESFTNVGVGHRQPQIQNQNQNQHQDFKTKWRRLQVLTVTFKQSSVLRTYPSHITCLTFFGCYTEYPNHKRNGFLSLQISSNIWNILHEALSTLNDILFFIDLFVLSLDFEKEFEAKLEKGRKWKWYYP